MLPRSRADQRVHPDCPADLKREIDVTLATSLAGKRIHQGETLGDVVKRCCPKIFEAASLLGFDLRFDLAENTHAALVMGRMAYRVMRKPLN